MNSQQKQASVVNRIAPPLALWIMNRLLTRPNVIAASSKLDRRMSKQTKRAKSAIRTATRNASANATWLAAGLGAITVGVGLIARATSRR